MVKKFYEKTSFLNTMYAKDFFKLPEKCQEMFFQHIKRDYGSGFKPIARFLSMVDSHDIKSPIEKIFLMAFSIIKLEYYDDFTVNITPQKKICIEEKVYYADFLLRYYIENPFCESFCYELIIECDGHDFHNSTKEQVKKDNERDFDLKRAGYDVLHFSGSQIYENPWKCADEALSYFEENIRKRGEKCP